MFKNEADFEKIVGELNIDTELNPAHCENLRAQMLSVFNETAQKRTMPLGVFRRSIMKSPIIRIAAAAAVIIILVLIGIHQLAGSAPAFADIVRPLLTARTATCKITINIKGEPPQTRDCMFMEPSRMRQVMPNGVIQISDKHQGQKMKLYPAEKKAVILETTNMPEDKQRSDNWFLQIRECLRQAQETEDESVKFIGKQKIDGVKAIGYRIGENSDMMDMTVWADTETLLPIRIEYSLASAGVYMNIEGTITYSDIVFNEELDESLFEVPEGYESQTMQYDYEPFKPPGEEDLIQALRLWSGITNGKFPSELNIETLGEFIQVLKEKMGLKFEKGKAPDLSNPKLHEFWRIWRRITRGVGFVSKLPSESDWHYTGKEVYFGDSDTPIFWYRPEGSETYRVIYGDLSIQEVAPDNLTAQLEDPHKMVALDIKLPKPMFVGTPQDRWVPNLEKPLGKMRPPFLAPVGTKNVAFEKPVSSSDEEPIIGEIEMITDGDKEAADGSYVELGPFLQHVTIDLEAEHNIYAIVIWHYHKQARVYFDVVVQVADDPDFITNVTTLFNNDIDNSAGFGLGKDMHYTETNEGKLLDAKGVRARYVRLYSNGNTGNDLNHYIEVEVYGTPAK